MSAIESLNSFGRWLIPYLGRLSLELAVLAAVVLVAILLLRVRSARLRHVFWGLVLAKPVATLLIASPFSLYWFLKPPAPEPPVRTAPRVVATAPRTYAPRPVMRYERPPMVRTAPPPAPPWWQRLDEHGVTAGVWIGISSLLALRLLVGFAFVGFLRKTAEPQRAGPLPEAARGAARALGMRRPVRVSISPIAHGPVLAGVLRPEVLLPGELVENLPEHQLRLIIAHESAHARRKDNLVLLIQRLAEVFLFFHPAVWLCGWAMRRDAEAACDDAVLAAHADAQAEYAGSLIEVAAITRQRRGGLTRKLLINTFAATETRFTQRVSRILEGRRRRMTLGLTVAALAALTIIGILGLPTAAAPKPDEAKTEKEGGKVATEDRKVQREEGKVWIEGMEEVDWGGSFFTREDSQVRCLVEALRCAGRDVDYADVMGLSGAAFKLTMAPNLFVAEIHSEMGMDWPEVMSRVWGIEYDWMAISFSDEDNPDWRDDLQGAAAESLGRGIPLFYMNGEWNLLVGYREDGSAFICKPYAGDEKGYKESETPTGFVGDAWFASVLRESGKSADRQESMVRSLQAAVQMSTRPAESDGNRLFGFDAYEAWIAALEQNREDASKHGNAFSYSQLLTSRQAAAKYLRRVADELDDEARDHLLSAADRYEAVAERLDEGKACVAPPWDQSWTAENRAKESGMLRECMADEKAAVAGIEAALAALGRPAYRAAAEIRPELRNMLNYGRGVYPAPGLPAEEEDAWARIFDAEGEERVEGFVRMAERHGCTLAEYGDAVLWLNERGRIDALFYSVDQRDLAGFRRFFDLLVETGSPFAYTIVECPEIYDVLSHQPDWYIRHNNQLDRPTPEERPSAPAVRDDLLGIDWGEVWSDVAGKASLPPEQFAEALAELAGDYDCTQALEDGLALWRDADGEPVAIFAVCEDTDLHAIRKLYAALDQKDCPLAWLFLRLTYWDEPVFDILSLSRDHYMAHRARVGPWHEGLYPDQPAAGASAAAALGEDVPERDAAGPGEGARMWDQVEMAEAVWGAGLPTAVTLTLQRKGAEVRYADVVAASGWAFGFDYDYANWHVAALRLDQFEWLPQQMGYRAESVSCRDRDKAWDFLKERVDAGLPVLSTLGDGGLITDCRVEDGKRQILFDGEPASGWLGMDHLHPMDRCFVMEKAADPRPQGDVARESLVRAMGAAQGGVRALETYLADVRDPDKDFDGVGEWFCWATFQRLTARKCCADWLRSCADALGGEAEEPLRAAADHYERAFEQYSEYDRLVHEGEGSGQTLNERLRSTPEKIAALVKPLETGIKAERDAVAELGAALRAIGEATLSQPEISSAAAPAGGTLPPNVRRDDGVVWIEGLEEMDWGGSYFARQDSFMACMTEVLRYAGKDVTYAEVMGLSASAFKITMMENCHPGATQGHVGIAAWAPDGTPMVWEQSGNPLNFHSNIMRIFGITWSHIDLNPEDTPDWREQLLAAVRASVDRGVPVFYMDGEWGLIVGYREDGSAFICRHEGMEPGYEEMERPRGVIGDVWWANTVVLDRPPVPRRQAMIDSLRSAALLWGAPKAVEVCYFGREAYETWLRVLDDPADDVMLHGNAFCYAWLLRSRRAAAEYLRMVADELGGEPAGHLRAAANAYESVADRLYAGRECVTQPWKEKWTPENRAVEAGILRECMADEEAAVAEVAAALHALGEPVPEPLAQDGGGAPAGGGDLEGDVVLADLRRHGMPMNQLGNLLACARHLGYEESEAWLSGATAFAFALNVGEDLCPSGPSAWSNHKLLPLAANAGLPIRTFYGSSDQPDFAERQKKAFAEVRKAIDAGMPVIGTGMDTPEVYLVPGYDGDGNYIYIDFIDDRAKKRHHESLGFLWFQFPTLGEPADDRTTVREALSTALELAAGEGFASSGCGLRAYGNWITGLAPGSECDAQGAAYIPACWSACRRQAAPFLREAKERLDDPALAPHFDAAIRHYGIVAERLSAVSELFPLSFGDPAMEERLTDAERRQEGRRLLAEARDAEADGLRALARIAVALGADGARETLGKALASTGPGADDLQQDGGGAYREALLGDAVTDFKHIADNVAGHRIETCVRGADEDIYPQPYCYLTTMLVQMHAAGWEDVDLDTLAAVSGASAFFGYESGEFRPKYAFQWRDPNRLIAEATGYCTEAVRCGSAEEAWAFLKESVDSGRPVSGWHGELMLLAGYRDGDEEADRQVFAMKDGNGYFAEWWDWEKFSDWVGDGQHLSRHSGRAEPQLERDVALRVMRDLVSLSEAVPEHIQRAFPNATFGLAGIEAWAADCADMEKHEDWGMCHPENPQWTVRNSTAVYLERVADESILGADATEHVRRASELYRAAYRAWQEAYGLVGYAAPDGSGKVKEKRLAAADAVRKAAENERQALARLRQALAAEGVVVPWEFQQDGGGREPSASGEAHMLEGLECAELTSAELSAVLGALHYLGRDVSPGWLYGATGHAFAINIRPTVCVSGPYAWDKTLYELAPNIGCRVTGLPDASGPQGHIGEGVSPARRREVWDMVRAAVERGLPCYAWEISWMPDYSLVTGYDETGYYYTHANADARGGPTPWKEYGSDEVRRVELCDPKPDEEVVKAALEAVLRRAATRDGWVTYQGNRSGPAAFDLWADELALGHAKTGDHAWNTHFWSESRRMAVEFLEEAKERLPGRADAAFDEAIAHYGVVRDRLEAVAELMPWDDGSEWGETLQSDEQARLIREAGATERKGLEALAEIVVALGGTPPDLSAGAEHEARPVRSGEAWRFVLEGVRKVAYRTDRWRFTPFCNALDAALQYLGQDEQYDRLMCTSGAAFRMTWTPKAWDGGNSDILGMTPDTLEPMRRAIRSAGYEMVPVAKAEPDEWAEDLMRDATERLGGELTDEAGFRRLIVESIDRGRPVIAFGIIGPPEACLVTGYDERGDYLVGWNCFQDDEGVETDGAGRFRVRDWYPNTCGLLLFGEEAGRPGQEELDRETLKWALRVLRTRRVRISHAGPDAFEAWAADMLNDEYFPEDEVHLRGRLMCHWDSMTVTAFRGGGGATRYLEAVAERHPEMAEHLRAAAECLEKEDVVHGVAPGEEDQMERLADHEVRGKVADSILHARDMHVQAANHIEAALLAAGVREEEVFRAAAETAPSPADAPDPGRRLVLDGVPQVSASGVDGHYALTPFPGCLQACLEYMDDDLGFEREGDYPRGPVYDYLMGTTGAAFRLFWKPGWHEDNRSSWAFEDPEQFWRRGFAAAGYDYTSSGHVTESERKERLRPMAIESIRGLGRPAIAFGVLGAPCETIIAGYDEGGRVAIGWHYWQEHEVGQSGLEFEPNGYFRKRNWEEKTTGMLLIGDKTATPERRVTYLEALQNALRLMREPMQGERHSGLAAYDAWAEHLLRDEEVAAGGGPGDAYMAHADAADVIALGRHCASCFLEQAAEVLPEAGDDLLAASKCFAAEHDLIWKMWELVSGWRSDEERQKFSKPDVRRQIVPIIREAREKDAEAADHIERALLALGVPEEDIPRGPAGLAQDGGGGGPEQGEGAVPERLVLEDVPRISDGVIEPGLRITPWPACLLACLEYMHDDLGFADGQEYPREAVYAYLTGTTGTAFRLVWKGWGLDNWASWMIYDDAGQIFRRGEVAIGYESVSSTHVPEDEKAERFRSLVIEMINRGRPLISHGIVGPPEETIVAGYDEGGDVVIGWSAFQDIPWATPKPDGFEPNGMFRKWDWVAHAHSMGALGEKIATPDRRDTYTEALQNALRIVRAPGDRGRGLAAYDAWAEHLLRDDEIAAGTPDDAFDVHGCAVDMIAEGRHFAAIFLEQAAGFLPEAEGALLAAADCYAAECELMRRLWGVVGGKEGTQAQRQAFLDPEARRRMVSIIQQARDRDAEAADHIEAALLALGVPEEQIARVPPAEEAVGAPAEPSGKAILEGLEFPEWTITQLGCMHGCLDYLDHDVPRPWLYGGTAHAFFINIHEDVDLESVTAWDDTFIRELVPNLGFHVDRVRAVKPQVSEEQWRRAQMEAWGFARRSIQLKQPCYGWELKAPYGDWWLVTGYDDVGYYYDGWETGGPTPWRRLGEQFIPVLDVRAVKLCEAASDEATVRDALVAALEHSRPGWDASADDDAHFGPEAYDTWAGALESGEALHNHHAYNAQAWHECREMAVEFLLEAKRRLPGRADAAFDEAIAHYSVVRDRLADVKELTPIDGELGWDEEPKLQSAEAAALVREAGAAERKGLAALARIVAALGGEVSEA